MALPAKEGHKIRKSFLSLQGVVIMCEVKPSCQKGTYDEYTGYHTIKGNYSFPIYSFTKLKKIIYW